MTATATAKTKTKTATKTTKPRPEPTGLAGLIARRAAGWSVDDVRPGVLDAQAPFWNLVMDHYFRVETEGWHRLPDTPSMVVGVHAGGTIAIDAWVFALQWWRRFGEDRIMHGTAHDVLRAAPGLGDYFTALGVLPPNPKAMDAAWKAGHDVLIYPGGEIDALRSFRKRDRALLGDRTGFIKVALRSGVPIVPYATIGGSDTGIILSEGRWLAKVTGAKQRLRSVSLPIVAAPPFGVVLEILPSHIPMPAKLRYEILEPIELDKDPERVDDEQYLQRVYDEIQSSIQSGMDRLAKRRSFPLFG